MKIDRDCITKLNQGDSDAFNSIYNEYYKMLFYVSVQYLKDQEEAKEAVQEAFVKLWENRKSILASASLRNYLYTLVKNNCLDQLKKHEIRLRNNENIRWMEMHFQYEAMLRLSFDSLEFQELKLKVDEAIDKLPDNSKKIFKMSRFEGLKNREIAERLDVSEKTVEAHVTKSIKFLRKELRWYLPVIMMINETFL